MHKNNINVLFGQYSIQLLDFRSESTLLKIYLTKYRTKSRNIGILLFSFQHKKLHWAYVRFIVSLQDILD